MFCKSIFPIIVLTAPAPTPQIFQTRVESDTHKTHFQPLQSSLPFHSLCNLFNSVFPHTHLMRTSLLQILLKIRYAAKRTKRNFTYRICQVF